MNCSLPIISKARKSRFNFFSIGVCCTLLSLTACKKLVEVSPPVTSINSSNVFQNDATAIASLNGIYSKMSNVGSINSGGFSSISFFAGLSADEFVLYSGVNDPMLTGYYLNALNSSNTGGSDYWNTIYPTIYSLNAAIEGLSKSTRLNATVKQQLTGEAKFMRAFSYFYLVNFYGDVPLVTSTDYTVNNIIPRSNVAKVWEQIVNDLTDAENLLSDQYLDRTLMKATNARVRPNKWVAAALLARVFLYTQNWAGAFTESSKVIDNTVLFGLSDINSAFLSATTGNNEAIWQLQPVIAGQNTPDAILFCLPATGPNPFNQPVYLSDNLLTSFEPDDQRKINWTSSVTVSGSTYVFPFKYKISTPSGNITENETLFRLSEQYLIRAEAQANGVGNSSSGAIADLNKIRNRADLQDYTGQTDKNSLVNAILHERQVELFSEFGHRWLDMKRSNTIDAVMSSAATQKGGVWNSNKQLYPIPLYEIQHNSSLIQNEGY